MRYHSPLVMKSDKSPPSTELRTRSSYQGQSSIKTSLFYGIPSLEDACTCSVIRFLCHTSSTLDTNSQLSKSKSVKIYWLSVKFDWLWISLISLITSVKINRYNGEKYFFTDESVKINWFNSEIYLFYWWISEKANHWFNQWKFDWFRFREKSRACEGNGFL